MKNQVKVIIEDETEGSCEILNKLKAEQKILEIFETEEIESVKIIRKKREPAMKEPAQNN